MSSAVTSGLITGAIALLGGFAIGWATTVWRGNVEHSHWLRQQRYDSYSALLTVYEEYTTTVSPLTGPSRSETLPSSDLLSQLNDVEYKVTQRRARLRLLGPPEVYAAAYALDEAVAELTGELRKHLKSGRNRPRDRRLGGTRGRITLDLCKGGGQSIGRASRPGALGRRGALPSNRQFG